MLFKFFLITVFIRKNETRRLHMLSLCIFEDLSKVWQTEKVPRISKQVWQKRIVYKKTDEWYLSDNEWQRVVQRVKANDSEWQWVVQRVTTNDNEWQRVVMWLIFLFRIREETITQYPEENSLNLEEDLEEGLLS